MTLPVRRAFIASLLLGAGAAWSQPTPPVRLLVGYAAGGPVDAAARLMAPALSKELGQPVVVENKPGANATLAGDIVSKGPTDGSLLWFAASPTVTISPNVMKKMPFDPGKDLTPVAPVLSYYNVLVINKDLPFKNLKDLIDHARANPEKLSYGSAGIGGSNHLSGELLAAKAGVKLTHVPYKGNAPAMTDVIGGQIAMMFDIVGSARNYIASGKVRALAVTSPARNPSLPDVPTMGEAGVAGFDVGGWYGVYGAANTPAPVVAKLNQAVTKALAQPELKARLEEMGYELWTGAPKLVAERAQKERALWASVTKGIEIE
ncbi:Bug family tripartite tricarboxylate transporter substrate binding protein [Aquabacterium sp.]|uniref:Bug family tripartite tricarboxylate transporter substrate binding protein n=1 Tax=Aquabacterium sp. TaxID=1872578 RepID=UPI003782D80A